MSKPPKGKKTRPCKHDGCTYEAIDRLNFCAVHATVGHQCRFERTDPETGRKQRCKRQASAGLTVCERHGGAFPNNRQISEQTRTLTTMQKFVKPYEGDVDPYAVFETEFRRTLGRIAWYDEQLAELSGPKDLVWGLTKEERVMASDYPGTNKTYEARVNMFEELQRWERKHLVEMEKVWIAANLDEKRLSLLKDQVELGYNKVIEALRQLGLDPSDRKVREVLGQVFYADPKGKPAGHIEIEQIG